ncbi:MAG TPA: hypothetical protein VL987_16895 [Cellvibrio sp.]|nr:hypothetical protein [Cellvibrio sp.]
MAAFIINSNFYNLIRIYKEATFMPHNLISLVATGMNSNQIAEIAAEAWQEIDGVLSPIIGREGMAMLYKRALHLIRDEYPWLMAAHEGENAFADFAALKTALSERTKVEASAASLALYQRFYKTLVNLIGEPLTDRLFKSIPDNALQREAKQNDSL